MGDGILVYFGYPRAHEDEAERSVRAGLDIVATMAELNAAVPRPPGVELAVWIGIATGPVIASVVPLNGWGRNGGVAGRASPRSAPGRRQRPDPTTRRSGVGDQIGGGTASETAVAGETPNLAARLQALAQPNQIVVSGKAEVKAVERLDRRETGDPGEHLAVARARRASRHRGSPRGEGLGSGAAPEPTAGAKPG
jgi:class 3 adenylate cyclase